LAARKKTDTTLLPGTKGNAGRENAGTRRARTPSSSLSPKLVEAESTNDVEKDDQHGLVSKNNEKRTNVEAVKETHKTPGAKQEDEEDPQTTSTDQIANVPVDDFVEPETFVSETKNEQARKRGPRGTGGRPDRGPSFKRRSNGTQDRKGWGTRTRNMKSRQNTVHSEKIISDRPTDGSKK